MDIKFGATTNIIDSMEREYLEIYEFGSGRIGVQSGRVKMLSEDITVSLPFIDLTILKEPRNVGEDLGLNPVEATEYTKLVFTSIESLEVLERALAFCRKELEK